MDNQAAQTDTDQTQDQTQQTQQATQTQAPEFTWKSNLAPDYANSPTMKKFADTKDGFNSAVKSHLELEKMMGHDKVPIPKGKDDPARILFNKALGIPDKPEGYGLPDIQVPDNMKGFTFDKAKFAETVHKYELTPSAAKGLWTEYAEMTKQSYQQAMQKHQESMTQVINQMKAEWGDSYQSRVELGQMVISKFSEGQEMNDYVTSVLSKDPRGIKFLSKVGEQFAENKIGDFKYQRYSLSPEEAQRELDTIRRDMSHPYNNEKASQAERMRAIDYANSLIVATRKGKTS